MFGEMSRHRRNFGSVHHLIVSFHKFFILCMKKSYLPFLHEENNNANLKYFLYKSNERQTSVLICRQSNTLLSNRLVNRRTTTKNRSEQQQTEIFWIGICCFSSRFVFVSYWFGSMFTEDNIHLLHCQTPKQACLHLKTHHNFIDKKCLSPHLRPFVEELSLDELDCSSS